MSLKLEPERHVVVVGGPNGAGKTTFAKRYLAEEKDYPYIGADAIAAKLDPDAPERAKIAAGREFLQQIADTGKVGTSFLVETTLSGRSFRNTIRDLKDLGYDVTIAFIFLENADFCVRRVEERVRKGGHNVPEEDIRRRFIRSKRNFWDIYRPIADRWLLIYNSGSSFEEVASGQSDSFAVLHEAFFQVFHADL